MATLTRTSADVTTGSSATATQYNNLRADMHDLLTALFGADTPTDTWDITSPKFDTIAEQTAGNGVAVDGVILKDSNVTGAILKATSKVQTNTIEEVTLASGVTIDGVLAKDGAISGAGNATFASVIASSQVQINGIVLSNGGAGLRLNTNLDLNGNSIRGLNKAIDYLLGEVARGGAIPLPSGYAEGECQWSAGINYTYADSGSWSINGVNVDWSGRTVNVQCYRYNSGWYNNGSASYVIIGMHNRV